MNHKLRSPLVGLLAAASLAGLPASAPAAFPSNNGKVAFARRITPTDTDIFTVAPTGGAATRLTSRVGVDTDPAWSPDGTRIAFTSDRGGNLDVYVMNADGTAVTQLTTDLASDAYPAWSPDGNKIAFTSNRDGDSEIFVMNADGTGQTQLTFNALTVTDSVVGVEVGHDEEPAWSPDGLKISFVSDRPPASSFDVYVMNADGSGQAAISATRAMERSPSWAPGGSRIAVAGSTFAGSGVLLANPLGGALSSLANLVSWDTDPAYSPDGNKIVYRSAFNPSGDGLYTMWDDGTGATKLTAGRDYDPDWQPCATCPRTVRPAPPSAPGGTPTGGSTPTSPAPKKTGGTVAGKPTDSWTAIFGDPLGSASAAVPTTSLRLKATPARLLARDGLAVSIKVAGIDTQVHVQLLGITTQGLGRCAAKSRAAIRRWLFDRYGDGRPVALVTDPRVGRDRRGRLPVYVERSKPAELQLALLRSGLAKRDRSAGRFTLLARYVSAEGAAKRAKKGVWCRRC